MTARIVRPSARKGAAGGTARRAPASSVRRLAALLSLLAVGSCLGDSPGGVESPPAELALVLAYSGPAAVLAEAFDKADNLVILVEIEGVPPIQVTRDVGGSGDIEVRIPVELPEGVDQASGTVDLHLRRGSDILFEAFRTVIVHRGENSPVEMTLSAVAHTVDLSPSSMALETGETGELVATVRFATGDDIPGAPVSWSTNGSGISVDQSGTVTAVSAGSWTVEARSGDAVGTATVVVTTSFATISGTVTADGEGISGVTVSLSGPTSSTTSTDAGGAFQFTGLDAGTYDVTISGVPADYACSSTTRTVTVSAGATVTVSFSCTVVRTASIGGTVTQGSSPLAGVTVSITGPEGSQTTSTNSSGIYSFSGLLSGSYTVEITPPDGVTCPTTSQTVSLSTGESATADFTCDAGLVAYVTNESDGTVSVIDVATGTVVGVDDADGGGGPSGAPAAAISVGSQPYDVAFTPDGSTAYVSNTSSANVSVIDVASGTVTTTGVQSGPRGVAILPDGSRVYVANASSGSISVIDASFNSVINTISVGPHQPDAAVAHPGGSVVYVTQFAVDDVIAIDTGSNSVLFGETVGDGPLAIAVRPDGSRVYVVNFNSNNVSVLGAASLSPVTTIPVGTNPAGIAVRPDGAIAYVTIYGGGHVAVIDLTSNAGFMSIPVPNGPHGVAFSPDGSLAYVTQYDSNTVTVIDASSHTVIGTITVGSAPSRVAFQPAN